VANSDLSWLVLSVCVSAYKRVRADNHEADTLNVDNNDDGDGGGRVQSLIVHPTDSATVTLTIDAAHGVAADVAAVKGVRALAGEREAAVPARQGPPQHDAVLMYAHADDADGVRVGPLMQADGSTVWQLLRVAVGTPNSASGIGAAARSNHQASQCVHHAAAGSHRVRSKQVRRGRPCQHPGAGALTHAVARVCGGHGGCGWCRR
jgi:hypothetical protein